MSLRAFDSQRSFYHTDYLAGNLFGPANRYRLFREKIWPKLLELGPKVEALYCAENGRPPIDPVLLCGVTLLQFMEKVARPRSQRACCLSSGLEVRPGFRTGLRRVSFHGVSLFS
jgi:hypothetical protein